MAVTGSEALKEKMQLFRSHGVTRNKKLMTKESEGGWYYQQVALGFNYRMTELQAALGISQMQRLDEFVAKRHILQKKYDLLLEDLPIIKPYQDKDSYSALHLYPIQIDLNSTKKSRKQVFNELRKKNISVNVHYIPIYSHPYYEKFDFSNEILPIAENYYNRAISIPLFSIMTSLQQNTVEQALLSIFKLNNKSETIL